MLTCQRTVIGAATVLYLRGSLDALTVAVFKAQIEQLVAERCALAVVDLAGVTLIDSSGVGGIVTLFKRQRALGRELRVTGLTGQPQQIFKLLRLERALDVHATVEAAVAGSAAEPKA